MIWGRYLGAGAITSAALLAFALGTLMGGGERAAGEAPSAVRELANYDLVELTTGELVEVLRELLGLSDEEHRYSCLVWTVSESRAVAGARQGGMLMGARANPVHDVFAPGAVEAARRAVLKYESRTVPESWETPVYIVVGLTSCVRVADPEPAP